SLPDFRSSATCHAARPVPVAGRPAERGDLGGREAAPAPALQASQPDRAEPYPNQPSDGVPDHGEEAPDLALPTLPERNAQPGPTRTGAREPPHGHGPRDPVLQLDALEEPADPLVRDRAPDQDLVHPVHTPARVQQAVRDITLVRQEQQPLAVDIQTADVEESGVRLRDEVVDRRPALRIGPGRHMARRLVERDPDRLDEGDRL